MKRTQDAERIRLESLPCAAACLASGCTLVEVKPISQGRCEFILEGPDAELAAADYLMGRLEGNLLDFMRCFDDLRTAIRRQGGRA